MVDTTPESEDEKPFLLANSWGTGFECEGSPWRKFNMENIMPQATAELVINPRFGGEPLLTETFTADVGSYTDQHAKLIKVKMAYRLTLNQRMEDPSDPAAILKGKEFTIGGKLLEN